MTRSDDTLAIGPRQKAKHGREGTPLRAGAKPVTGCIAASGALRL